MQGLCCSDACETAQLLADLQLLQDTIGVVAYACQRGVQVAQVNVQVHQLVFQGGLTQGCTFTPVTEEVSGELF